MTKEEKELLLTDLSSRLPYGVKFGIGSAKLGRYDLTYIDAKKEKVRYGNGLYTDLERCKPFLRPMSSMTDEEKKVYKELSNHLCGEIVAYHLLDYLNARHLDYRGLIPKGLALEAPKDMYNLK